MRSVEGGQELASRERVPAHLRQYVVEQDLGEYNEIDQAVWRFVLLQLQARLRGTAHPAYIDGLNRAGIGVERIPSIAHMDALLARVGWGAVCVDGFIPPLAFQEFQALGILPISANIRTLDHLVYTPAPDIIHEAAGHAPILLDATYAGYLRKIGRAGMHAFSSAEDACVYRRMATLSEVKENPSASAVQIDAAENALSEALSDVTRVTEAVRLSRLYWWTAEYGLLGRPEDYRLYGAGLLSSLAESHFCHAAAVGKLWLSSACVDVAYDITRPQPQLFVARDFDQLNEVLEEVEGTFAFAEGGKAALEMAKASSELATLTFGNGVELIGEVVNFGFGSELEWVALRGPGAWVVEGSVVARWSDLSGPRVLPVGRPIHMDHSLTEAELRASLPWSGDELVLKWTSGLECRGRLERCWVDGSGFVVGVTLLGFSVLHAGCPEHDVRGERLDLGFLPSFQTARPGAACSEYAPPTEFSRVKIPRPRCLSAGQKELCGLYEQAIDALRSQLGGEVAHKFAHIYAELQRAFPEEWLLRWNLLESLLKLRFESELQQELLRDLRDLEIRFLHRQPVASGLAYLERLVANQ